MNQILPLAPVARIIKELGKAERVGEDATGALREELEKHGEKVSQEAAKLAVHAKRKTVKAEDIRLAAETLRRQGGG